MSNNSKLHDKHTDFLFRCILERKSVAHHGTGFRRRLIPLIVRLSIPDRFPEIRTVRRRILLGIILHVLLRIHDLRHMGETGCRILEIVRNRCLSGSSTFCRDKDDTVSGFSAINCSRRCILENLNRLDIICIDGRNAANLQTIDNVQRVRSVVGRIATDPDA